MSGRGFTRTNPILIDAGGGKRLRVTRGARRMRVVRRRAAPRLNARTGGFLGIEVKFADFESVDDAFATTWATMEPAASVESISAVAQGDGESQRDGRVYHIKSLHVQGRFHMDVAEAAAAPQPDLVARICVVWDTQTNGAQLTATNVMDGGASDDWDAFRNLQFSKRFRVLFDRKVIIKPSLLNEGGVNAFAAGSPNVLFKFNHTFRTPMKVICSGTTGVIASVTDNSLHVIGVANSTQALLSYQARVRFVG